MRFFLIVFIVILSVNVFAEETGWNLVENSEKMKLYNRVVPGSEIKEVKAVAFITGTVKEAVDIMFDRLTHPKVFKYIIHSELLKKDTVCDWSYNVIDAPMASDRDYLVKSCEVKNSDGTVSVTWEPFTDAGYPEKDGKVRVIVNRGYWKFRQLPNDELEIEYYIYTDPAGSLPLWVKNLANKKAVPDTIMALHNEIAKRRKSGGKS
ncbi:MAG TPA: hypothetical protein PLZ43_03910 [bacterium]|nr:hypothetical protein [bacterium]